MGVSKLAAAGHLYMFFIPFPTRLLFVVGNQPGFGGGGGGPLSSLAKTMLPLSEPIQEKFF